ncbi:insulin receptor substrate 2 [Lepisosteus oculatus]|uniref:insulin receptor substrate 2 n=1 Tax=Lepisosteus oculatus TaxID=7918 RepID=UPI00074028D5|nr:PREDICTED: insulin receptor substrate 2 [Lepisosteus oculatus]XP_015219842.1 PREDICTED: insulin receptor substrate 2 [Lepisosteus oculatus]XP_015219843.1 PREDICTED: insulin receptor substrate 2 [Lepisosteus oculatus]
MASSPTTGHLFSNVHVNNNNNLIKKCGYLKKQKHGHKRFFVLKEQSDGFPARLEYYENEKKWKNKSAAKRVIPLDSCLNINKRADAKHKHLIALYTKDEYFAVAAENEQEQESWYIVLTELMNEGKVYDGSASTSTSSLSGFEEANYGLITPASAVYKEVWQVNLKSKGLGQSKNLTGVYRLCLSSRTISFVKLNSEAPSVILQLMNIRRCGHSDNFFFIEVGRSASTGPGELWMQADDSVVAQNIHETILEAMKAMKELSEFRPRSKSQSSGTNPISVPTRRHLNNLPPSQTGLPRRSRTDSMAATSPANKFTSCRIRTASEGDGTMSRPVSVNGSPISPSAIRTHLSRSNTVTTRPSRMFQTSSLQHSKSMSMPVSHSPPSATSPVSLSSSSGHGSASDTIQRPSSGSASVSGSPSDGGFMSFDDYGSSPGDMKHCLGNRSNTPESIADTPPSREGSDLYGYMTMERPVNSIFNLNGRRFCKDDILDSEKAYRKRTYSLTTPPQQRATSQVSSASLDEYTLMRATYTNGSSGRSSYAASPKVTYTPYPEDYGDIEIGSHKSSSSNLGDDGYMPMTPGVAPQASKKENYMPMSPTSVSAPKQIINPRSHPETNGNRYRTNSPGSCSLDDNGYMRMWCGSKLSVESSDGKLTNGDYMNMSPIDHCVSLTPPDYFLSSLTNESARPSYSFNSLPRSYKSQGSKNGDSDQYVVMNLQNQKIIEESNYCSTASTAAVVNHFAPSPVRQSRNENLLQRGRASRPTRLSLDTLRTLPSMNEHPLPAEPKSPGEYINIDFSETTRYSPPSLSTESPASSLGSTNDQRRSPLSDYMNIDLNAQSPKSVEAPADTMNVMSALSCSIQPDAEYLKTQIASVCLSGSTKDDYTEMTFGVTNTPPQPISQKSEKAQSMSPTSGVKRLNLMEQVSGVEAFLLPSTPPDPDRGAKVIRADPQGRRRHSSETFSSTTTVTPVFPSFAHDPKRHSSASVENVSLRKSEGTDEEYGSPMCRETSAGFQNGLNYIALDLMDENLGNCETLVKLKTARYLKGGISGLDASPYTSLGFLKETATAVKD